MEKGRKWAFLFQSFNPFFFLFLAQALTSQSNTIPSLCMQALSCLVMKYMPRVQGILETETHARVLHLCSLISKYHWTNSTQFENSESLQNIHPIPWSEGGILKWPAPLKWNMTSFWVQITYNGQIFQANRQLETVLPGRWPWLRPRNIHH